jgi:SulP family sulfate permease
MNAAKGADLLKRIKELVPILEWLPRYRRTDMGGDVVGGVTVAALLIPQGMAYAQIAGLPPVTGLYASTVPILAYVVFGKARILGVGPLATISIISLVGVQKIAPVGSPRFIAYSATVAVLVGLLHIALGVARLGFITRVVSEPVMVGFLAGVGLIILATQLGPISGVSIPRSAHAYDDVWEWLQRIGDIHSTTLALGLGALVLLVIGKRWHRVPVTLLVVALSAVVVAVFDLKADGVGVVGSLPSGLPGFEVPLLGWAEIVTLLGTAFAVTLIGYIESIGLIRNEAERSGDTVDPNQELIALGMVNLTAGFFEGMVSTGALTRTSVGAQSGARTQMNAVVSVVLVVATLTLFSDALADVPQSVLAAVVVMAVLGFLKVREARSLWSVKRADFWLLLLTFVGTFVLGLEPGLLLAVAASLGVVLYRVSRPRVVLLGVDPRSGALTEIAGHPEAVAPEGTLIVRVDAPLFFANAEYLVDHLRTLEERRGGGELRTVILDASGVDNLDSTAAKALVKIADGYQDRGVELAFVNVKDEVRSVMEAVGLSSA